MPGRQPAERPKTHKNETSADVSFTQVKLVVNYRNIMPGNNGSLRALFRVFTEEKRPMNLSDQSIGITQKLGLLQYARGRSNARTSMIRI